MRGKKRPHDEAARAVGIALVKGVPEASKQTGIPQRTIRAWKDSPEYAELRLSAREAVAESMWVAIQVGIREVFSGLTDPEARLRDKADAVFGLIDKHQLLSGHATSRSESKDITHDLDPDTRRKITEWLDERMDTDAGPVDGVSQGASAEVR